MASCNMCRDGLTALKNPCPNGCQPDRPQAELNGLKLKWPDGTPVLAGELLDDAVYNVLEDGTVECDEAATQRAAELKQLLIEMEAQHNAEIQRLAAIEPATETQREMIQKNIWANQLCYRLDIVRETWLAEIGDIPPNAICELLFTAGAELARKGLTAIVHHYPREVATSVFRQMMQKMAASMVADGLIDMPAGPPQPVSTGLLDAKGRPIVRRH